MLKQKYIALLIVLLALSACEGWLDVNESPNSPQDMDYQSVLPAGITSVMYVMGGSYQVLGALWSQHWTQSPGASQYAGIDSYDLNSSSYDDNQFGELYSGALKAFEYVKDESAKENEWNFYLIATVMQCYTFQVLADLYGEIPFSEALSGESGNLTPQYEQGQDIYDSLLVRIDEALEKDLDSDNLQKPEEQDVLFLGEMDRWIEFANTLKLKILLRQSEARPEIARAGIEKLYANEAGFLTEDAVFDNFSNQSGKRNPLYETDVNVFGNNPNLILSQTLYSYLIDNDDYTRLNLMYLTPAVGGAHNALEQGNFNDPEIDAGTSSSSYSKPILFATQPVYLMSYTEACFLQAEAIIRYGVDDYSEAKDLYNEGLRAAYNRLLALSDLTDSEKENLISSFVNGKYRFRADGSPLEDFIEQIITQKWVSLAGIQSLETFLEHNRTHYPKETTLQTDDPLYEPGNFTVSENNVTSGRFPKRLIFPESEVTSNPNTPAMKPVWEKIWWDTKPDSE